MLNITLIWILGLFFSSVKANTCESSGVIDDSESLSFVRYEPIKSDLLMSKNPYVIQAMKDIEKEKIQIDCADALAFGNCPLEVLQHKKASWRMYNQAVTQKQFKDLKEYYEKLHWYLVESEYNQMYEEYAQKNVEKIKKNYLKSEHQKFLLNFLEACKKGEVTQDLLIKNLIIKTIENFKKSNGKVYDEYGRFLKPESFWQEAWTTGHEDYLSKMITNYKIKEQLAAFYYAIFLDLQKKYNKCTRPSA